MFGLYRSGEPFSAAVSKQSSRVASLYFPVLCQLARDFSVKAASLGIVCRDVGLVALGCQVVSVSNSQIIFARPEDGRAGVQPIIEPFSLEAEFPAVTLFRVESAAVDVFEILRIEDG